MIVETENLSFAYRGGPPVLRDVSLALDKGELLTVLGRNGAGKSTLFGCMLGLLRPQSGRVRIGGEDAAALGARRIASLVGFVPQNHTPGFGYSVFDFVLMGCAPRVGLFSRPGAAEREAAREAIERMELAALAARPYTELSGGERQKAAIARAIAARPQAVLFDEPTAHLDVGSQIRVLRILKSLCADGYAVAVTTHDPNHALLLGGRAAILGDDGALGIGDAAAMLTEERLRGVYGADIRLPYVEEAQRRVCVYPRL